jgi:tetratricopeptide (TPR) repeat protein
MKLVPGGSLVPLIDRYTHDPRAAARLVAEAAEAVAHAHARGILHRDLKPANILVDQEGHPHVTDFGLAKRVEADVELTQSGAILGTPAYMSPEQATGRRGSVTTASDFYGLGAVLYALLTGRAPFGGDSVVETIDAVRHRPPEPPRRLNAAVPRDLETICLKCLEKDPRRRYPTAQALADDLVAWLESRPIAARRVGTAERAWLWCKRRPAVAGLSAATVVATLAGLAFGVWQWSAALRNARIADASAYVARVKSLQARTSEEAALRSAQEAKLSTRIAYNGVDDLMTDVAAVDLADIPQMAPARILLLEKARKAYERLREENANREDAELLWVSAKCQGRLGDIQAMLGQFREAEASYRDAIGRLGSLAQDYPAGAQSGHDPVREGLGWDILRDLVRTRLGFSVLLKNLYRLDEAEDQFRQAVASGQPLDASGDSSDGGLLAEIDYQQGVLLARDAELRGSLSSPKSPEFRASKEAYQRAIRRQKDLAKEGLSRDEAGRDAVQQRAKLARFRNNLGKLLQAEGRYEEAENEFRQVLDTVPVSERSPGPRWQRARAAHNLGALLLSHNEGAPVKEPKTRALQGREHIEAAKDLLEGLQRESPEVPQYREELAEAYTNLGRIEQNKQQRAQAVDQLHRAAALSDQLVGESPNVPKYRVQSAEICRLLASNLSTPDDMARAEVYALRAIDHLTALAGRYRDIPSYLRAALGSAELQRAKVLAWRKEFDRAREAAERAVEHHQAALNSSPESPKYREKLRNDYLALSIIRLQLRDVAGAARAAEELPRISPDHPTSDLQAAVLLIECATVSPDQRVHFYDRAMNVLVQGVDRQVLGRELLDQDALKSLRDRPDFRLMRMDLAMPPDPFARGD